jgi:chromosome partitioning protein
MRAVLVANSKGGSGKTTLSTNLAGALANRGDSVVLWDLDRQKSALEWLSLRSPELPLIHSLAETDEPSGSTKRKHDWLIMDSPAGLHGKSLERAIKPVDKILMPIQPSLFDMATLRDFLAVLQKERLLRKGRYFLGIVCMRVDPRTRAAATLEAFLKQFELAVLAYLRDTQVYANAAFQGKSIFDLPHYINEKDVDDWKPLLKWLDK